MQFHMKLLQFYMISSNTSDETQHVTRYPFISLESSSIAMPMFKTFSGLHPDSGREEGWDGKGRGRRREMKQGREGSGKSGGMGGSLLVQSRLWAKYSYSQCWEQVTGVNTDSERRLDVVNILLIRNEEWIDELIQQWRFWFGTKNLKEFFDKRPKGLSW